MQENSLRHENVFLRAIGFIFGALKRIFGLEKNEQKQNT